MEPLAKKQKKTKATWQELCQSSFVAKAPAKLQIIYDNMKNHEEDFPVLSHERRRITVVRIYGRFTKFEQQDKSNDRICGTKWPLIPIDPQQAELWRNNDDHDSSEECYLCFNVCSSSPQKSCRMLSPMYVTQEETLSIERNWQTSKCWASQIGEDGNIDKWHEWHESFDNVDDRITRPQRRYFPPGEAEDMRNVPEFSVFTFPGPLPIPNTVESIQFAPLFNAIIAFSIAISMLS